jgi:hypothetical protein
LDLTEELRPGSSRRELVPVPEQASGPVPDMTQLADQRSGCLPAFALLAFGLLLTVVLILALARVTVSGAASLLHHILDRTTAIDTSAPAVVDRIRKLSRLETVTYSIDKIVEGERASALLPDFLVGDKILLIAHGEVIAGIDLSQLKSSDVSVDGESVRIHLPAPQLLTTRVDNARTRVYSRITGLLVTADPDLESKVREAAEQQISQAALADGILDKARQNARESISALLSGLGFKSIDIQ